MKKLNQLSESDFLKILFGFITAAVIAAAVCMPDRSQMLYGLWKIVSQPNKISTNYFQLAGYSAAFLNAGLVCLFYLAMYVLTDSEANHVSSLAFILNLGFAFWGINVINMWPSVLGVVIYGLVKRQKAGSLVNAALFSAGLAPLITELMVRYPSAEVLGFNPIGILMGLIVGIAIGFVLPAGMAHAAAVHRGFDLYSAALPMGMAGAFLQGILYKTMGVKLPESVAADMTVASRMTVNIFCLAVFGCCIAAAILMGCRVSDYAGVLKDRKIGVSVAKEHGNAAFLMNFGVYGLFILGYYNLLGLSMNGNAGLCFNSVTIGIIFCMLACCNSGSNPVSVLPIMVGYAVASAVMMGLSKLFGGSFANTLSAQGIAVGLCYANGLSPICRKYGIGWGIAAGALHYLLVSSIPMLHGAYLLHNGGFTAALVCIFLFPLMDTFCKKNEAE